MTKRLVLVLLVLVAGVSSQAIPVLQDGETYQCWDFLTPDNPAPATAAENPYGTSPLLAQIGSSPNSQLMYDNGAWSSQALNIVIELPNNPQENPYKLVYVEMVYMGDITLSWVKDNLDKDFTLVSSDITDVAGTPWKKISDVWRVEPNPPSEKICYGLSGSTEPAAIPAAIDSICIRTLCVPEPLTMALLGLGSLVLFRRK